MNMQDPSRFKMIIKENNKTETTPLSDHESSSNPNGVSTADQSQRVNPMGKLFQKAPVIKIEKANESALEPAK